MAIIGRKEGFMLSTFTTRFRNFIWFLIFTFTLYSMPHFDLLFPYKFHLFFPESQAAETETTESQTPTATPEETTSKTSGTQEPSSEEPSAPQTMTAVGAESSQSGTPSVTFKVDDFSGAAHMNYPIVVPPGRDGLAPNLLLTYNSISGNSWVGVGWDLSAGFIQRRGVRKGVPKYNDSDVFELQFGSGAPQELVPVGSGEYRLKIEGPFLKIIFSSTGNYWEVWEKSGIKMKFGSIPGSRIGKVKEPPDYTSTYRWFLDRVKDPKTNYMELIYYRDQDANNTYQIYLQEIKYNAQVSGGLPHNHRILFNLETSDRPDPIYNYRAGFKMWTRKRLSSIEVKTTDNLVRKYQLVYKEPFSDPSAYNERSLLSQIILIGNDGISTLPKPVKFFYQAIDNSAPPNNNNRGFDPNPISWTNKSAWSPILGNYIRNSDTYGTYTDLIDMNGDGLPDRVVYDKVYPYDTWSVYFNNGSGFNAGVDWPNPSAWGNVNGNLIRNTNAYGTFTDVIDMNGDGLPDRVVYDKTSPYNTWTVYFNNGSGFDAGVDWPNPSAWALILGNYIRNSDTYGTYTDLIDMNGDGLPDRVVYDKVYPYDTWSVYFNNGSGFNAGVDWPNPSAWGNVNGNLIRNTNAYGTFTDVIDMNGDGLPDRVVYDKTSPYNTWTVYFNNGSGFDAGVDWPNPSAWALIQGNYIRNSDTYGTYTDLIDMNGDGLPDRVVYDKVYPYDTWSVYLNNGSGFDPTPISWPIPPAWYGNRGNYIRDTDGYGALTDVIDMNGDGLPDRVIYNRNCGYPYTNCPWSIYLDKGPVSDLLSKVENEFGGTIGFTYLSSTAYQNYHLPFKVQTVSSVSVNDGNGVISTTNYTYWGGYFSAADREFRGFEHVKQTKPDQSTVGTWYYQDKTGDQWDGQCVGCRGKPYEQQIKDSSGNLYTMIYYFHTPTSPYPGVTFPALTGKDDLVYDGTSTPKRSAISYEYDLYGNVKRTYYHGEVVPETGQEIPGDERDDNTNYSCVNDSTQYVCRPSTTFTKDSSGATKSQTWFTYYTKNGLITKDLLTKEEWHSGCINPPCINPITSYGYDNYGNQTSITDPKANTTTIDFDTVTYTYPVKATVPHLNFYTERTYDYRYGKVLTDRDYNGNITVYTYDVFGRTKTVLQPPDTGYPPTKEYFYENFGTVGSQKVRNLLRIDSTHQTWKETYFDGLGRPFLTMRENVQGNAICTETEYNNMGLVSGRSYPHFQNSQYSYWTYFDYDIMARVTKTTPPDGKFTTMGYDKRRTSIIDANKHAKVQEKDPYGRLIKIEEYTGIGTAESPYTLYATTTYQYDVLNNLVRVIDAAGNQTTMVYDTLSRKVSMTDPDMCFSQDPNTCKWTYKYDANGNLTEQTDAKGQTILFGFFNPAIGRDDPLNRVMKKDYPSGTDIVYTYDQAGYDNPKGRLTSVMDSSGMTKNFYDERGRTKKTIKTVDAVNYPIETTFDSLDRIKSVKYPDLEIVSYTYDTAGNLSGVSGAANYANYTSYNAIGQPINVQYGNGVTTGYTYNDYTNRLASILTSRSGQPLQSLSYLYDDIGNVTTITDSLDPARTQQFQYDYLNRLIQADSLAYPTTPITYQYNQIGNMTSNSQVGLYIYPNPGNPRPHAVTQAGTNIYTYDNNGNMITGAGRTIGYDYDNRPSSITQSGVIGFVYDYQGQRVKKMGASTTVYIGKLYELTGGIYTKYIFAGGNRVASKASSAINYYHTDHLGSSNVITDVSGTMVEEIYYFPFGGIRLDTGSVDVRHKYTGQEEDPETGLYYYGARYYDPVLARFISPDPIVPDPTDPQSLNRYSYTRNNPLRYIDPTGNFDFDGSDSEFDLLYGSYDSSGLSSLSFNPGSYNSYSYFNSNYRGSSLNVDIPTSRFGSFSNSSGYYFNSSNLDFGFNNAGSSSNFSNTNNKRTLEMGSFGPHPQYMQKDPLQPWIYIPAGFGGGVTAFSGEYGRFYLVDPATTKYYLFGYVSGGGGLSLSGLSYAAQVEGGILYGPRDPIKMGSLSLTVSGFAAWGKGYSAQFTSTGLRGYGEWGYWGYSFGAAGGRGAGLSLMVTYSWYIESGTVLPEKYMPIYQELLRSLP